MVKRVTRWTLIAQSLGAKIMYCPGKLNATADALPRFEVPEGVDAEEVERTSQVIIDELNTVKLFVFWQ